MLPHKLPIGAPILDKAIDRHPLVVSPNTLLTETVILMSQVQHLSCSLPLFEDSLAEASGHQVRSNCVLVMQAKELIGIFTERDLVRLIASNLKFDSIRISEVMTENVITLSQDNFQDVFAALFLFRRYRIRHLPVVDREGQLVGVISHESLRSCLQPTNLLKLRRVSEVMNSEVIQASPQEKVINLAKLMAENQVSCVVMMAEISEERLLPIGIVTERDILQFQALEFDLAQVKAQEVMSTPLFLLNPEDSLWTAHQQMQERHVRRLVVSWNWGLGLGIITQTGLLRVFEPMEMYGVIETLQHTVQQLEAEKKDYALSPAVYEHQTSHQLKVSSNLTENLTKSSPSLKSLQENENSLNQLQVSSVKFNESIRKFEEQVNDFVNDASIAINNKQNLLLLLIDEVKTLHKSLDLDIQNLKIQTTST